MKFALVLTFALLLALPGHAAETGSLAATVSAPIAKHKAGAVVFVKSGPAGAVAARTVQLDQKGMVFVPRILPIAKGWRVEFLNSDPVAHNVYTIDGEKYDLGTWPQGQKRPYTFTRSGVYRQLCKVHDDMIAYIVVLDTPWFATSDKEGKVALPGLPAGAYTFGVWHEKLAAPDFQVQIGPGAAASAAIALKAR
ncbi:MAG: hypothetical protein FJ100_21210 [Deltaproteobacteria bacterium]|nr:hypothetical protein [Deltaproteobacteria bacterium]